ncbi:hypothetical protein AAG906_008588 [Vitis piasezkii]
MENPIPLGKMMENESSVARVKIRFSVDNKKEETSMGNIQALFLEAHLNVRTLREHERYKEEQVEELKHSMQSGMHSNERASSLVEEMAYQDKVGNFEAAAAIQRRLDPDVAISMEECFVLTASIPHAILINCSFVLTAS